MACNSRYSAVPWPYGSCQKFQSPFQYGSGSQATTPDATISGYQWTQTSGASVQLNNPNTPNPTFVAPIVVKKTSLTFSLVVQDSLEQVSKPNTVTISVTNGTADGGTTVQPNPSTAVCGTNSVLQGGVCVPITSTTVCGTNSIEQNGVCVPTG
jgi:K319-like protein